MPSAHTRVIKIFIAIVAVVFALSVFEVALRIVGFSYPLRYVYDSDIGYRLRPGFEGIQSYPIRSIREETSRKLGVPDFFYPDRRLETFSRKHGIPFFSLARACQEYADRTGTYLAGFSNTTLGRGHWNQNGHRFAANELSREICGAMRRIKPPEDFIKHNSPGKFRPTR